MKKLKSILKVTGKVILSLLLAILLFLGSAYFIGKQDFGSPGMLTPELNKVAFVNVNVIPMDSNYVLSNHTVLIESGTIKGIYGEAPNLNGYEIIDGKGQYLMPGLMDAHAHIFDRSDLALNLSQGVTTVRNMMGFPMHLRWKEQVENNEYPGATLFTSSPTLNMGEDTGGPFHKVLTNQEEAKAAVNEAKQLGYDFIKIYDGLSKEVFEAIMEEAHKTNMRVAGHPPRSVDLNTLSTSGLTSIEHAEEVFQGLMNYKYSKEKVDSIAKILAERQVYVTPSLIIYHYIKETSVKGQAFLDSIPQDYINPLIRFIGNKQLGDFVNASEEAAGYNTRKDNALSEILRIFHKNQVPLLLGTDHGPNLTVAGYILHREIEMWKQNDIPDYDILRAGTINVADALGVANRLGTIATNKEAQLILLKDNPLTDARNTQQLSGVFHNARWYNESGLKALEVAGKDKSSTFSTIGLFLEHLIKK